MERWYRWKGGVLANLSIRVEDVWSPSMFDVLSQRQYSIETTYLLALANSSTLLSGLTRNLLSNRENNWCVPRSASWLCEIYRHMEMRGCLGRGFHLGSFTFGSLKKQI
jgi:hypothetical protein